MPIESITLEILSRKFSAITDEMYFAIQRAARSSYVKEAADFATALLDPDGNVFAYPPSATFSFLIDTEFKTTIDAVPDLMPGDVIITNDPYTSGGLSTHLPDLHLLRPYFHEGRIIAFGWSFLHCADIGGAVPSSISPALTNIFAEGIRIPPMKLVRAGVLNQDLIGLLRVNSRMGDLTVGDLKAMLGALEAGSKRLGALVAAQGVGTVLAAQSALQDYAERKARDVLRKIPDGSYEFADYLDDDMVTGIPVRVRLKLTLRDGEVEMDLAGTDPQVRSAYNVPTMGRRMYWLTFRLTTLITSYDTLIPHNAGMYRGISVVIPRGSIMHAEYPEAVGVRATAPRRLFDCVTGAILKAATGLVSAASGGTSVTLALAEIGADGFSRVVEVIEPLRSGMGAFEGRDGIDARDNSLNNMRNHPLELVESQSSVLVEEYDIRPDSGGPGQWRGGVGQSMTARVLCDGGIVLARGLDRMRFAPWGVHGGQPGARLEVTLNRGRANERRLGKIHELRVLKGDIVTISLPGGGGFGDPMRRDPASVLADVERGFVSIVGARRDYGVVIGESGLDHAATTALRRNSIADGAMFSFGPERMAWEAVFDDAAMAELNAIVYALPKSIRQDIRAEIFEATVPGIVASEGRALSELIPDPAAARRRLRDKLATLRPSVTPPGGMTASETDLVALSPASPVPVYWNIRR